MAMTTHENTLDVAERQMLRWMFRATKLDRIRNVRLRGTTKVEKSPRSLGKKGEMAREGDEKETRVGRRAM